MRGAGAGGHSSTHTPSFPTLNLGLFLLERSCWRSPGNQNTHSREKSAPTLEPSPDSVSLENLPPTPHPTPCLRLQFLTGADGGFGAQ